MSKSEQKMMLAFLVLVVVGLGLFFWSGRVPLPQETQVMIADLPVSDAMLVILRWGAVSLILFLVLATILLPVFVMVIMGRARRMIEEQEKQTALLKRLLDALSRR